MRDFWRAIKLASINKRLTSLVVGVTLVNTLLFAIEPLLIKRFFDLVDFSIRSKNYIFEPKSLLILVVLYVALRLTTDATQQMINYFIPKWWNVTRRTLSTQVFTHLESLSLKYFESNSTGKIRERVDRGIGDLNAIAEGVLLDMLPQFAFILLATYVLMSVNWIFGTVLILGIVIFITVSLLYSKRLIPLQDKYRDSDEKVSAIATESIINIKTIKSYASEAKQASMFRKQLDESLDLIMKYVGTRVSMNTIRFLVANFSQVFILSFGVYLVLTGKSTLGSLTLAWQYTGRAYNPLWYLSRMYDDMQRNMRSVRRVFELLDTEAEIKDVIGAQKLKVKGGKVRLENIHFQYDDKKVINGINLDVNPGSIVAFVGKSGVGKTTLVKLLMRFYETTKGKIYIDDQDITKVTQRSLRENIGYVLQDSSLFNDTVLNNIRYGKPGARKEHIYGAARIANAEQFIDKLPKKYLTVVGERGVKLSGGEQQRINIARAALKNAPILVLDEATSSLDSESEQLVQDALWKLIEGHTTFIIAHRLSTVMKADLIVVMDKGKIVEQGTHKDLVEHKGIYAKLFEIQSGGYLK